MISRQQQNPIGKILERKDTPGTGCFTKGLLQITNSEQSQSCDRLITRSERLRQQHAYKTNNCNDNSIGTHDNKTNSQTVSSLGVSHHINEDKNQIGNPDAIQHHECGQCGKAFCSKIQLGRHAKIHSGEKAFLCSQCEQTFHRKDHLKTHEKTHQTIGSNERVFYECERVECGKTYNSYASFMKHRKTHEIVESSLAGGDILGNGKTAISLGQGNAPHQRTLSVGSGIQYKERLDHSSIGAIGSPSAAAPTAAANTPSRRSHREQGEKRFQCMQCSKKFPTSKDLKRHDVVHTGMYPVFARNPSVQCFSNFTVKLCLVNDIFFSFL